MRNSELEMTSRWWQEAIMLMPVNLDVPSGTTVGYTFLFHSHSISKDLTREPDLNWDSERPLLLRDESRCSPGGGFLNQDGIAKGLVGTEPDLHPSPPATPKKYPKVVERRVVHVNIGGDKFNVPLAYESFWVCTPTILSVTVFTNV